MNKKNLTYLIVGIVVVIVFSLLVIKMPLIDSWIRNSPIVGAEKFVVDEWIFGAPIISGPSGFGDYSRYSWHRVLNPFTGENYREFVIEAWFENKKTGEGELKHTIKLRNDGKFLIDDKAVCFRDGTSSDGGTCAS